MSEGRYRVEVWMQEYSKEALEAGLETQLEFGWRLFSLTPLPPTEKHPFRERAIFERIEGDGPSTEEYELKVTRLLNGLSWAIAHIEVSGLPAEGFKKILREESG